VVPWGCSKPQTLVALLASARVGCNSAMSTKSRQMIYGSRIRGAKIRAENAREEAAKAIRLWLMRCQICYSAWGPNADRHHKSLIDLPSVGSMLGADSHSQTARFRYEAE
jgi:hypothetical protein